ncbi:uncharacterized protein F4822DRAFT_422925 [Hypoxylon trugodes]|uniref:uncharacterized protein n=1 Tax=Hypoxylon trugodes TaxID=326681 RepID=UPI002197A9A8|nr:uncharacterized protein F4822DRAFT_422925 [Hypoxylon trugodes]KAI1382873.1 hypothetical protein F4822DRAFT_422925 [Hypoxylon trugodes]
MKAISTAIATLLALAHQCCANLDIITLNTKGDAWIQEARATLVLGKVPNPMAGDVALWSAIMMDKRDFLQGVTENALNSPYCNNLGSNWCNFAYTLVGSQVAKNGAPVSAAPGSRIKTHYKLNPDTNQWDQNLYVNDKLLSSISTSQGQHGVIFYVSIECAAGTCSPAPAHAWEDISITLNKADPSFKHTGAWQYKATGGEMSTPDNGKTWNFTTVHIPDTAITG